MIALTVNLAMSIGFRPAARAIRIFYDAYGLRKEITSVRESFANVTKMQVAASVTTNVGRTLISKRRAAYAEHRKALKVATSEQVLT